MGGCCSPANSALVVIEESSCAESCKVFDYFQKYNYEVRERGEVITFAGNYKASRGQAAALVFYVFFGEP